MRRKIVNGMLIGTAAGLVMAALFKNNMFTNNLFKNNLLKGMIRPTMATRKIMGQTKKLGRRTGKMVVNAARDVSNIVR